MNFEFLSSEYVKRGDESTMRTGCLSILMFLAPLAEVTP